MTYARTRPDWYGFAKYGMAGVAGAVPFRWFGTVCPAWRASASLGIVWRGMPALASECLGVPYVQGV